MTDLILPWPPKQLSPNARGHWAIKMKIAKDYKAICHFLTIKWMRDNRLPVFNQEQKYHLFIDFIPPDKRRRDDDNLYAAFKNGRDGLAQALGIDDSKFVGHPFLSDTETVKHGEVRVKITTEQVHSTRNQ